MIVAMRPWIIVIALAGCHGSEPPQAPKPVASQCKRAADQMVDLMAAGKDASPDNIKRMSDMIADRCEKDHWSAEAQHCVASAKATDDLGRCENLFTKPQADALVQSVGGSEGNEAAKPAPASAGPAAGGAAMAPGGAPPPPPAPTKTDAKRSPTKKPPAKTSDPCEGGQ